MASSSSPPRDRGLRSGTALSGLLAGLRSGPLSGRQCLVQGAGQRYPAVQPGQPEQLADPGLGADHLQAAAARGGALGRPDQRAEPGRVDEADPVQVGHQRAAAGGSDLSHGFTIGDSHRVTVDLKTDQARFYINGSLAKTIPVSGGMGGYDSFGNDFYTTSGVHLTMGGYDSVWMTSPNIKPGQPGYYHELVYDDVQISDSGEYMHQSPGGLWCLGHENCSHGCVRMTADGAAWWRHTAYRGDPVTITGTPRVLAWDNGWGYWQQPWPAWLTGSSAGPVTTTALGQAGPAAAASAGPTSPAAASPAPIPTTAG